MLASMLWWRGSMRKLTVCAAHAVAWRNPMLCAHDNGFMVVDGYMVGAFEVYRHCWRQGCACVCTAPDACAHVVAPVCVAAWVAVRSGVVSVARRVFMQWAYSFSGSEGGLGSDSSRRSVKGLSVLHSVVAQQAFKGGGGSAPLAASVVFIRWYPCSGGTASAASRAALAASLRRMLLNVFGGLPTTAQPVFIWAVGCSRAARCGFVCRSPRRRSSGGSAVQFQWRRGRPRKLLLAALGYIRCSKVAACPRAACHPPHGRWCPYKLYKVQRQRQRAGRPRRPLLAAWSRVSACCTWRGSQCSKAAAFRRRSAAWWSHSEGTASAAGRVALAASPRCARPRGSAGCIGGSRCSRAEVCSVQHARCALWWLCKWRYILGSGKGGLGGLPSLRPSKGIDGWHSVAQQVLEGGGCSHAACRSPHAGWWSCSGGTASAAARAASAASPRSSCSRGSVCSVAQQAFKAAVRSRAACCVPCGWWLSSRGVTASAAARTPSAASPRHAHSKG